MEHRPDEFLVRTSHSRWLFDLNAGEFARIPVSASGPIISSLTTNEWHPMLVLAQMGNFLVIERPGGNAERVHTGTVMLWPEGLQALLPWEQIPKEDSDG